MRGNLEIWKPENLPTRACAGGLSVARPPAGLAVASEWAPLGCSRRRHGRPHGRAPRCASGAREVRSQAAAAVQRKRGSDENGRVVLEQEAGARR
jgi:hypothetical protein